MFCLKIVEQLYTGFDRFLPVNAVMKGYRGSSNVLFAYLFLLLFGQIGNIYNTTNVKNMHLHRDSNPGRAGILVFFLEGAFKGIYLRERNFTLSYVVSEI